MMTLDMIRADLVLRGWEEFGVYIRKEAGVEVWMYYYPGLARVATYTGPWPLKVPGDVPLDEDQLRTAHDIITKHERGHYEPREDGGTPNIARVDSLNAPERLGIQNDRPEYGGASYRRTKRPRYVRR